jgi:hypothetical protein
LVKAMAARGDGDGAWCRWGRRVGACGLGLMVLLWDL